MRPELDPWEFPCKACGEYRPDDKIDVKTVEFPVRGIVMRQNFQFCNDREDCRHAAEAWGGYMPVEEKS
jgi:hypothetical protein